MHFAFRSPRAGPSMFKPNFSRRRFFGITAGAAGGVLGSGLWTPARGEHDDDDDRDRREGRPCPEQDPIPHINAGPPAGIEETIARAEASAHPGPAIHRQGPCLISS